MTSQPTPVPTYHHTRSAMHGARGQTVLSMLAAAGRWLSDRAVKIREQQRRRAAIRELQRWSPHMLTDIGLSYGSIPAAVDGLMRRDATAAEAEAHSLPVARETPPAISPRPSTMRY